MIRTIVVDDEPLARRRIRSLLKTDDDFEVITECADGRKAVRAIEAQRPDLVFLDVQMPELDGFGVLQSLQSASTPLIIFVTAYDCYAVKAFEAHALDYLLKPFSRARFFDSLARVKESHAHRQAGGGYEEKIAGMLKDLGAQRNSLPLKSRGRIVFVPVTDIEWIEADANYIRVHAGLETHVVRDKISSIEQKLNPRLFLRVHRSFIVSTERIKELVPCNAGEYVVVLQGGKEVPCGRTYREHVDLFVAGRSLS
jgi:two-component system LytT family response regulator